MQRRRFLQHTAAAITAAAWPVSSIFATTARVACYRLALGQWTYNRPGLGYYLTPMRPVSPSASCDVVTPDCSSP